MSVVHLQAQVDATRPPKVSCHSEWNYFADAFSMIVAGVLTRCGIEAKKHRYDPQAWLQSHTPRMLCCCTSLHSQWWVRRCYSMSSISSENDKM